MASLTPLSTAGIYSLGMTPPLISSTNSKPLPGSSGSIRSQTWPYWPRPPDWRTNLPSHLDRLGDGLAVGDLRLADIGLDLELAHQAVDDDLQCSSPMPEMMVWPVSSSVLTRKDGSSWISFCRAMPSLFLVGLGLRLDGDGDDRLGELHRLEDDRMFFVAQGVAGGGVLQADRRGDVAGVDFLDLFTLVGVHLQETADALAACPWSSCRHRNRTSAMPE